MFAPRINDAPLSRHRIRPRVSIAPLSLRTAAPIAGQQVLKDDFWGSGFSAINGSERRGEQAWTFILPRHGKLLPTNIPTASPPYPTTNRLAGKSSSDAHPASPAYSRNTASAQIPKPACTYITAANTKKPSSVFSRWAVARLTSITATNRTNSFTCLRTVMPRRCFFSLATPCVSGRFASVCRRSNSLCRSMTAPSRC